MHRNLVRGLESFRKQLKIPAKLPSPQELPDEKTIPRFGYGKLRDEILRSKNPTRPKQERPAPEKIKLGYYEERRKDKERKASSDLIYIEAVKLI